MRRIIIFLVLVGLVTVPTVASAVQRMRIITRCPMAHNVRNQGSQLVYTCVHFTNDSINPSRNMTIKQLTGRNLYGTKVVDGGGPFTNFLVPDPDPVTNPNGLTFTVVPGGASYFVCTTDVWGFNRIPNTGLDPGGNQQGFTMMLTIRWSHPKSANTRNFTITARRIEADRIALGGGAFALGTETSSNNGTCVTGQRETPVNQP